MKCVTAILCALMLVSVVYLVYASRAEPYTEAAAIAEGAQGFGELRDRFQQLAEEKGAIYAFEVLRRATLPPNTDLHLLGHVVGDALYQERGVAAIADCTQDFRNACSHAVVIGALNEFGETALSMIRDACKKAPGGSGAYTMCYHGLGHGVFAFYSYDLQQTIDFCRKTGTEEHRNREYIECFGGAIMELMGGGGHDREAWLAARAKYLSPTMPLSPCMDTVVPTEVKSQCLTYLTPQLWEYAGISMGSPEPALFAKSFAYCDAIPRSKQEMRESCFGGFGKEFFPLVTARDVRDNVEYSDAQLATVIEWCALAEAKDGKESCVADALSSAFWGGEKDPSTSFRLCAVAEFRGLGDACYGRLADDIRSYTEGDVRSGLCAQLPDHNQTKCSVTDR